MNPQNTGGSPAARDTSSRDMSGEDPRVYGGTLYAEAEGFAQLTIAMGGHVPLSRGITVFCNTFSTGGGGNSQGGMGDPGWMDGGRDGWASDLRTTQKKRRSSGAGLVHVNFS